MEFVVRCSWLSITICGLENWDTNLLSALFPWYRFVAFQIVIYSSIITESSFNIVHLIASNITLEPIRVIENIHPTSIMLLFK